MANENMVTIPLEEYIQLRRQADENFYIADRLGQFEQRLSNFEDAVWKLEKRVEDVTKLAMEMD